MSAVLPDRARIIGSPGERARFSGLVRTTLPLVAGVALGGYLIRAAVPWPGMSAPAAGLLLLLLAGGLAVVIPLGRRRFSSFFKGARGEERVAWELATLPSGFTVLHGVRAPGSSAVGKEDYDHVVVGPTGVFLVETKFWSGRVTVADSRLLCDGIEPTRPPLEQVRKGAARLGKDLAAWLGIDVPVQPILCFATARLPGGSMEVERVVICDVVTITDTIRNSPGETFPQDAAEKAVTHLRGLVDH
jgi:hypothetical protein